MDNNHQLTGRLHSIETFGTVDGPGIRVVLFFQGCPMRCQYCHNRDTWDTAGGREWTLEDLKQFVLRFKPYMDTSGGGVTATGGDPVLQHRFITRLFTQLKEEGKNPFVFETKELTGTIADFLKGEVRYSTLVKQFPDEAKVLHERLAKEYAERYEMYKRMAGG